MIYSSVLYCSQLCARTCPTHLDPIFKPQQQALDIMVLNITASRTFKIQTFDHAFNISSLSLFHQTVHQNCSESVNSFVKRLQISLLCLSSNSKFNVQVTCSRINIHLQFFSQKKQIMEQFRQRNSITFKAKYCCIYDIRVWPRLYHIIIIT